MGARRQARIKTGARDGSRRRSVVHIGLSLLPRGRPPFTPTAAGAGSGDARRPPALLSNPTQKKKERPHKKKKKSRPTGMDRWMFALFFVPLCARRRRLFSLFLLYVLHGDGAMRAPRVIKAAHAETRQRRAPPRRWAFRSPSLLWSRLDFFGGTDETSVEDASHDDDSSLPW